MKIHQIYTANELRNFNYLIELADGGAIVIDPWDASVVNRLLLERRLDLKVIINTHEHWDHIQGNEALVAEHGCEVWAHENGEGKIPGLTRTLIAGEGIPLDSGVELKVLDTPGHTFAHLCFLLVEQSVVRAAFTGDTLFNAGVGNCRSGDARLLYETISQQFHSLPDDVLVYPGHEYLENNLRFTLSVEPDNRDAQSWLQRAMDSNPELEPIVTTIGDERLFNSFFRLNSAAIRQQLNCQSASEEEVFIALRSRRDSW